MSIAKKNKKRKSIVCGFHNPIGAFRRKAVYKNEGLISEKAARLAQYAAELDTLNERYKDKELNNGKIIYDSYPVVTEWVLQKCFEECCQKRYNSRQIIENFLPESVIDIDIEIRRFRECYKEYISKYYRTEISEITDAEENPHLPVTQIANIKLFYFASLNDRLFAHKTIGKGRREFAEKFIRDVFGEDLDVMPCIYQAQILLAICGFYKVSLELLECANDKVIWKLVNYLNEPISIGQEKIYASNPIVEQWVFACYIADKLYRMTGNGKKLSKSRENYVFAYVSKLEGMHPFQVNYCISKMIKNSLLHQKKVVLRMHPYVLMKIPGWVSKEKYFLIVLVKQQRNSKQCVKNLVMTLA